MKNREKIKNEIRVNKKTKKKGYEQIESKRKPEKEYRFEYKIKPEIIRLAFKFGKLYGKESYKEDIEKWLTT